MVWFWWFLPNLIGICCYRDRKWENLSRRPWRMKDIRIVNDPFWYNTLCRYDRSYLGFYRRCCLRVLVGKAATDWELQFVEEWVFTSWANTGWYLHRRFTKVYHFLVYLFIISSQTVSFYGRFRDKIMVPAILDTFNWWDWCFIWANRGSVCIMSVWAATALCWAALLWWILYLGSSRIAKIDVLFTSSNFVCC